LGEAIVGKVKASNKVFEEIDEFSAIPGHGIDIVLAEVLAKDKANEVKKYKRLE